MTVVTLGPCVITQIKNKESDGYSAIQMAFEDKKQQRYRKSEIGHFKKSKTTPKRVVRECRVDEDDLSHFKVGMSLSCDIFKEGDFIDVSGVSKGRGFQGVVRRYHFRGGKASHGVHESYRGTGSIGMCTWPGRVLKGKKLPGQMGNKNVTVQNLQIVEVNAKENAVLIKGALPGHRRALVNIQMAVKRPLPENRMAQKEAKS